MATKAGRLSAPGELAARARVEAVFAAVDQLSPTDLNALAAPAMDLEARHGLVAELERLAHGAGRGGLLDGARATLEQALMARLGDVRPYPYGLSTTGTARAGDQAAIVAALRDLVAVAVMQDRLEPSDARVLAGPGLQVLGARVHVLDDPAWAAMGGPGEAATVPAGAPTEQEWATADADARVAARDVDGGYSPPGTRRMRQGFFALVAVVGVIGAVAWGLGGDSMAVALLVAAAVVALCWTFATWSPRGR